MAQGGQRKCLCCGAFFIPDWRNVARQRYCCEPGCRRASKAASQAAWLSKPDNVDYFKGSVHVQRVREWRAARYKIPCPCKWLILLNKAPIVGRSRRPLARRRYKIS